nr:immunoglobulin light chain junction region [Macaca mulatta]
CQQYYSTPRTV